MSYSQSVVERPSPRAARLRLLAPPLPREHGAWAWLLLPSLAGLFAPGWPSLPAVLFFLGVLQAFLLHAALESWRATRPREKQYLVWALIFGVGFHLTGILTIAHWNREPLLLVGAAVMAGPIAVRFVRWLRFRHRVLGEAIVVGSLSLLAPAVGYAGAGAFTTQSAFLWLPVALYCWGGITFVRLSLAPSSERSAELRRERRRTAVVYHAVLLAVLTAAAAGGAFPALVLAAYLPMLAKTLGRLWTGSRSENVTLLGASEALHAALFAALLIAAYRLSA